MDTLKGYWNDVYREVGFHQDRESWLERYMGDMSRPEGIIVDLGCGLGNNALYLLENGLPVVACDVAEEALRQLQAYRPDLVTRCFDMRNGLPFDSGSAKVVIADLSLHYFDEQTTFDILAELHRVLQEGGLLVGRVNALQDMPNKQGIQAAVERHLYAHEGIYRRFFDREDIAHFWNTARWSLEVVEERDLIRYGSRKVLWEFAARRRP
ncbi:class I SAM-dependent methyltransferase [Paenibacillus ferrarius]|uniref:class I SAM-dependent methyltransferase n=1 Tax=Paenibacillus ferrarius TaxID=1469647 RepID=UPI003D2A4954